MNTRVTWCNKKGFNSIGDRSRCSLAHVVNRWLKEYHALTKKITMWTTWMFGNWTQHCRDDRRSQGEVKAIAYYKWESKGKGGNVRNINSAQASCLSSDISHCTFHKTLFSFMTLPLRFPSRMQKRQLTSNMPIITWNNGPWKVSRKST